MPLSLEIEGCASRRVAEKLGLRLARPGRYSSSTFENVLERWHSFSVDDKNPASVLALSETRGWAKTLHIEVDAVGVHDRPSLGVIEPAPVRRHDLKVGSRYRKKFWERNKCRAAK